MLESDHLLLNQDKYNIDNVRLLLNTNNIILLENKYIDVKTKMLCLDSDGYYVYIVLSNFLSRNGIGRRFDKSNNHTINNINHYLKINNVHFQCISEKFNNANEYLYFKCMSCGEIVKSSWKNVNKNDNQSRTHVICPNCDGRNESIHALVLKQLFLYYYPDSIVEEKSYINPNTNKICPTDIVNHRLKIAIEIQSQWHDFDQIKIKDMLKKEYWISRGYDFYNPDIRDYSILEMCQIFFDIKSIPSWVNYNYSNKLNIKEIQELLNEGFIVTEIAKKLNVDKHRIYDAIYSKKIFYPKNYKYHNAVKKEHIL